MSHASTQHLIENAMIPWTLREVSKRRWRSAQSHETAFWKAPGAVTPQCQRVMERYASLLRELEQQGPLGNRILEVGCGPTCVTQVLSPACRVFADPLMTAYCSLCPPAADGHFVACIGEALPFREAVFDGVFCFNVLDHVMSPARFVGELVRVTRPGGVVVVGVYTHPRLFAVVRTALERLVPFFREMAHPFFFSCHSLLQLLEHHNLRVARVTRVYAAKCLAFLHRQDWVAIARKSAAGP